MLRPRRGLRGRRGLMQRPSSSKRSNALRRGLRARPEAEEREGGGPEGGLGVNVSGVLGVNVSGGLGVNPSGDLPFSLPLPPSLAVEGRERDVSSPKGEILWAVMGCKAASEGTVKLTLAAPAVCGRLLAAYSFLTGLVCHRALCSIPAVARKSLAGA
eukprot:2631847-Rhodomonas_salina.1